MSRAPLETCPECGVRLPPVEGPTHAYIGGSPSCWALFGEILAREYSDALRMKVHQLTVDSYAVQHPGRPEPRSIRSVWGHLASLYWQLDKGRPGHWARRVIPPVAAQADGLGWLDPPEPRGSITVADVAAAGGPDEHHAIVDRWARDVWAAWSIHHGRIAEVAERAAQGFDSN